MVRSETACHYGSSLPVLVPNPWTIRGPLKSVLRRGASVGFVTLTSTLPRLQGPPMMPMPMQPGAELSVLPELSSAYSR